MERGDLVEGERRNIKLKVKPCSANAASDVRILVVGNPCNTNCLIARSNAQDVPDDRGSR